MEEAGTGDYIMCQRHFDVVDEAEKPVFLPSFPGQNPATNLVTRDHKQQNTRQKDPIKILDAFKNIQELSISLEGTRFVAMPQRDPRRLPPCLRTKPCQNARFRSYAPLRQTT